MNTLSFMDSFIIFDPNLSKNENEDELKILYKYPKKLCTNKALQTIGLCEALSNFAKEFTTNSCDFVHTLKTRIIVQKLEGSIMIAMTVNLQKKTNKENEYNEEEVQDEICEAIVKHCQKMWMLFSGPSSLIIKDIGVEGLKGVLKKFFDSYIGNGMLDGYHVVDTLTGVHTLSIDKEVYYQIEEFITDLESKFPQVGSSLFLFSNSFVYGTVSKEDLGILFRYLTVTLLPTANSQDIGSSIFNNKNMGRFLIDAKDSTKVYLDTQLYIDGKCNSPRYCTVWIYKALQAEIALFINNPINNEIELQTELHNFMGSQLTSLAQIIFKKTVASDSPFKYLYWNPETLSVKCSLFPTRQLKSDFLPLVSNDVMQLMTDMKSELLRSKHDSESAIKEFGVKLLSDSWVICLKRNERQLYLAINKRNFSLVDVSRELRQACNRDFLNIFTVDGE